MSTVFKVGDKVRRINADNGDAHEGARIGQEATVVSCTNLMVYVDYPGRRTLAAEGWYIDNAELIPPPKRNDPKFLIITAMGNRFAADELTALPDDVAAHGKNGNIPLIVGDAVYKLVGHVERVHVTEECVPVQAGYRYSTGPAIKSVDGALYEIEVVAIRGDYAFVQSYKSGEPVGCTTVKLRTIPKQKRSCSKFITKLVKE